MNATTMLGWALCGLAAGLIARALVPGRQRPDLTMTAGLGVVGALAGGALYWAVRWRSGRPHPLSDDVWIGWVATVLWAAAVLLCYARLYARRP